MKRQAIAFFTMFSLIMMLAIYYITLPQEDAKVKKEDLSVMAKLNEKSEKSVQDETKKNNEIISDPEADEKAKSEAIIENEKIKELEKVSNECMSDLKKEGYETHVEIKEKIAYITILNKEKNEKTASYVIQYIYNKLGNDYFIEVSFKSE